jgi:predicted ATP-grasp superfamily ATP-dependent carboligase
MGVRFATAGDLPNPSAYLQEFVPGPPMSAVFLAKHPHVEFIGVTEQLIGTPWLHSTAFRYAGNIGPIEPDGELRSELTLLGFRLMLSLGVRGVFGVDFILHDGRACVVEVNPRYPASVEVIEHATGRAVFANGGRQPPEFAICGKAIYYAPHRIAFPASGPWDIDLTGDFDPWRLPIFADIPAVGAVIERGHPVLTIFATGSSPIECRERLQSRARELYDLFAKATP